MRTFQRASRLIRPAVGLPVLMGLAIVGVMVLALGCGSHDTISPEFIVADVPAPAGFKFNQGQSAERISGQFRFIRHLYEGSAPIRETADFYRTSMPQAGWTLVDQTLTSGRQRFLFDKGNESCHISIYDDWGTKVLIQILPKASRPTTPDRPAAAPAPKTRPTAK